MKIIGIDEAGRGPLYGSIFASAVMLDPLIENHNWLKDSKKMTKNRRAIVKEWIEENALYWSISQVDSKFIDKFNIRNANLLAFELCIRQIVSDMYLDNFDFQDVKIMIDGVDSKPYEQFGKYDDFIMNSPLWVGSQELCGQSPRNDDSVPPVIPQCNIEIQNVIKGDSLIPSISAASVLAKETHDSYIKDLILQDPTLDTKYNLSTNVGYGTQLHIEGLRKYGYTEQHRKTFLKFLN